MNEVARILMERDGLSADDARAEVSRVSELLNDAIINGRNDPADILMDELGLEPDYIFEVLECTF